MRALHRTWIAALLLMASPAFGGQLLPLLHPCEASTAGHAHGGATGHAGHDAPAEHGNPEESENCTCIGSCHVPVLPAAPGAGDQLMAVVTLPPAPVAISPDTAAPAAAFHLEFLPPSTAPPSA